jgi:hypothetical protein
MVKKTNNKNSSVGDNNKCCLGGDLPLPEWLKNWEKVLTSVNTIGWKENIYFEKFSSFRYITQLARIFQNPYKTQIVFLGYLCSFPIQGYSKI